MLFLRPFKSTYTEIHEYTRTNYLQLYFLTKLNKPEAFNTLYAMTVYCIKCHRTQSRLRILLGNLYHDRFNLLIL